MDDGNEKDIQDLIKQFGAQQTRSMPNPQFTGNPNQGLDAHTGIDNQGPINESTPVPPGMLQPSRAPVPAPTGDVCPQCNMVHPPIKSGEKCPNAVVKEMTEESEEVIVDVNKYLNTIQNILINQIEKKNIKHINKLFQNITIEINNFLEGYKE